MTKETKCDTCSEHSGVMSMMEHQRDMLLRMDDRQYHILVSILVTLVAVVLTGATTVYVAAKPTGNSSPVPTKPLVNEERIVKYEGREFQWPGPM